MSYVDVSRVRLRGTRGGVVEGPGGGVRGAETPNAARRAEIGRRTACREHWGTVARSDGIRESDRALPFVRLFLRGGGDSRCPRSAHMLVCRERACWHARVGAASPQRHGSCRHPLACRAGHRTPFHCDIRGAQGGIGQLMPTTKVQSTCALAHLDEPSRYVRHRKMNTRCSHRHF